MTISISKQILILVGFINVLVECEIPNLNVRKLDRQMIAKKRHDTLEMCKIFTEENAKIKQSKPKIIESYKYIRRIPNVNQAPIKTNSAFGFHNQKSDRIPLHLRRTKREVEEIEVADPHGPDYLPNGTFVDHIEPEERKKREIDTKSPNLSSEVEHKRYKRTATTNSVNPALSPEDIKKIESLVDKMYNDLEQAGEKIDYKKNPMVTTTTTTEIPENITATKNASRRLFFGPKLLIGPDPKGPEKLSKINKTSVYEKARWRHGIVPYFIDPKTYDAQLQEVIMEAFDYIEKATCIRLQKLRERPTDRRSLQEVDWVYITNPAGVRQCVHSNEKRKVDGVQMSVLGYDCMSMGDIVHEVMHILGFSHEHTRSDRDQYISILWDNIKPGYKKYFEISKGGEQYTLEHLPYDYASILHYPPRAFSKNGQVTVQTEPGIKIGQREGLSEIDLEKIGSIYASECVERNKDYLLKTCPSVVKSNAREVNITQKQIDEYFNDRLWPYGIVSYKLRDNMEFSTEEKENIKAVIEHIEKETCIQFQDMSAAEKDDDEDEDDERYNSVNQEEDMDRYDPAANPPKIIAVDPLHDNPEDLEGEVTHLAGDDNNNVIFDPNAPVAQNLNAQIEQLNEAMTEPKEDTIETLAGELPDTEAKRVKRQAPTRRQEPELKASRRHAAHTLILARTAVPGCKCPKPGKPSGNSVLEINADCFNSVNDLLHLFVHVLGLDHQHNMHDRDEYLHIFWKSLSPEISKELQVKLPPAASVGFPYDYQSVMHYPWLQIKDGISNMMYPIWNDGWAMGHWQGLSSFDVQKLNLLYFSQCAERQKQSQK